MLSQLSAEYFARSPVLALPVLALCIFLCVFIAVSLHALLARSEHMRHMAELPLAESETEHHD